jgi:hypothetical protein
VKVADGLDVPPPLDVGGCNDRLVATELAKSVAVITAVELAVIVPAVAVKLPEVAPAATVSDAGTVAWAVLEVSVTVAPPGGAAALKVTVQVLEAFDPRVPGAHCSDDTVAACGGGLEVLLLAAVWTWNALIASSQE